MEGRWVLPSQRQNLHGCESGLCPSTAAFICGCERKPLCHPASSFFFNSKWLLWCSLNKQHVDPATECHLMWLQTSPTESEKPTLLQLYDLNVLEEVGTHYRILGTFLLQDNIGYNFVFLRACSEYVQKAFENHSCCSM